jgi:hypothetical protein
MMHGRSLLNKDTDNIESDLEGGFDIERHRKTGKLLQSISEYLQKLSVESSISYQEGKISEQAQTAHEAVLELRSSLDNIVYQEAENLSHDEKCGIYYGKSEFSLEQAFEKRHLLNSDEDTAALPEFSNQEWGKKVTALLLDIEDDPVHRDTVERVVRAIADQVREKKKTQNDD